MTLAPFVASAKGGMLIEHTSSPGGTDGGDHLESAGRLDTS